MNQKQLNSIEVLPGLLGNIYLFKEWTKHIFLFRIKRQPIISLREVHEVQKIKPVFVK